MMQTHFSMLAGYNRWANELLHEAAGQLSQTEYDSDVGAFFHSMNGTLNHLLTGDRIWMHRFTGEGDHPDRLDAVPYPLHADLTVARHAEDRRILRWVDGLEAEQLFSTFTYETMTDRRQVTQHLAPALSHFFNHQTHHRGQAHAIVSILGHAPPAIDLIYYLRTDEGKRFA